MLVDEKRALSLEELDSQVAFELPERELPAVLVVRNILSGNNIRIQIKNVSINAANNLCVFLVAIGVACNVRV